MELAKVTSKGQVTIPIEIRKKLGISYGGNGNHTHGDYEMAE